MGFLFSVPETVEKSLNSEIFHPPPIHKEIPKYYKFTKSANGNRISFVQIFPENFNIHSLKNTKFLIWSHGNASNILYMEPHFKYLSNALNIIVIGYDYQGYGYSEGSPTENGCYDDITAIVNYVKGLNVNEKDIILVGRSLGTGVVIDYAYKNNWKSPIILISPYKTISKVVLDSSIVSLVDKFLSERKIGKLECPVKIFHGTKDKIINISHGKTLYKKLKNHTFEPTWLDADHHDIIHRIQIKEYESVIF